MGKGAGTCMARPPLAPDWPAGNGGRDRPPRRNPGVLVREAGGIEIQVDRALDDHERIADFVEECLASTHPSLKANVVRVQVLTPVRAKPNLRGQVLKDYGVVNLHPAHDDDDRDFRLT